MIDEDNIEFCIPENFLEKLYELTGSADKYKGFLIIHCNEKGNSVIINKSESSVIEMGLRKTMELYLKQSDKNTTK